MKGDVKMEIKIPYEHELDLPFIRAWVSSVKDIVKMIQKKLGDRGIPLETRWEMYLQIQPYLETDTCYQDFKAMNGGKEISWYDDFYLDRYAVQELDADFVEDVMEKNEDDGWTTKEEELKEEILQYAFKEGYGAFRNDW